MMNTETTTAPDPAPKPPLPVFHNGKDARSFAERDTEARRQAKWGASLADVLLGNAMILVRDSRQFPDDHFGSFEAWAQDRLGYEQGQRDRLLSAGLLDPSLVEQKIISRQTLAAVGSQPE